MSKLKLSEAQLNELSFDYQSMLPWRVICSKYNITSPTLMRYLRHLNITYHGKKHKPQRKLSEQQIDELCLDYQAQMPWEQICAKYSVTDATIVAYLNLRGISRRHNHRQGTTKLANETISQVASRYNEGENRLVLCKDYGITQETLTKYIKLSGTALHGQPRRLTDKQEQDLCNDYRQTMEWQQIQAKYEVSQSTIITVLRRHGVPYRGKAINPQCYPKLSKSAIETLIDRYHSDEPVDRICQDYKIQVTTLYKYLRRANISPSRNENPHYDFFACIDSEEKAYWLGFFAADGCVSPERNQISVALCRKDYTHLARFREALEVPNRIYWSNPKSKNKTIRVSRLVVASKGLVDDLLSLGIGPRKTYNLPWPPIPLDLERHFIRGYFDGDGCWTTSQPWQTPSLSFEVIGTSEFMADMQDRLVQHCCLATTILSPHHTSRGIARLRYGGNVQCVRIANYLYQNATIYLDRKRNIVLRHYAPLPQYRGSLKFKGTGRK